MANAGSTYTPLGGQPRTDATNTTTILQNLLQGAGPQLGAGQLGIGATQQQLSLLPSELQQAQAYNQAQAGYQQAGQQISAQQIGLSQLANQQQQAQAATQQGFETQQYNIQQGQYPEQYAQAQLAYQNAMRNTQGGQAIGGTQNTVGGKADINTLNQNYSFQLQDIARSQALSQLGQQSEVSGYGYSQQQLQNAAQNLALNAQANGLSQNQLISMLNYQQAQTGQSFANQALQLYGQLGQEELGQLGTAGSALSLYGFGGSGLNTVAGTKAR